MLPCGICLQVGFHASLTLMLLVTNLANKNYAKKLKMTETLAHGYSSESTQLELSNGYQHNRV